MYLLGIVEKKSLRNTLFQIEEDQFAVFPQISE